VLVEWYVITKTVYAFYDNIFKMKYIYSNFQAQTVGSYRGRLNMPNSRQLVISNMRLEDAGTFECKVHYPGSSEVFGTTDVSIVSAKNKLLQKKQRKITTWYLTITFQTKFKKLCCNIVLYTFLILNAVCNLFTFTIRIFYLFGK